MDLEVTRADLAHVRTTTADPAPLAEGEARIRVERFGLSANNVTYGVFGDVMRYWDFFPVPGDDGATWGRIPVWGFGEVVESRTPSAAVGERLYGCFPMGSDLVIEAGRADERGVSDAAAHRAGTAGAYRRYVRVAADPIHRADREDLQMLLYPLFFTSFVIDDWVTDVGLADATIVLSSASAKTAIGVAFLAHRRGARVVGLTSPGNRGFVEGLGCYDAVVTYDAIEPEDGLAAAAGPGASVYVDIAGNADVRAASHRALGDGLARSLTVGGTHWDHVAASAGDELPGPAPEFFFAPTQIAKRTDEWGADELDHRMGEAWDAYAGWADGWLERRHLTGAEAVTTAWQELVSGGTDPRVGLCCTLVDQS